MFALPSFARKPITIRIDPAIAEIAMLMEKSKNAAISPKASEVTIGIIIKDVMHSTIKPV
jgi:hypothetical protein